MFQQKDTHFEMIISKMKNNKSRYKAEIRCLSKELECERKKSVAYQNWANELCNKIKLVLTLLLEIIKYQLKKTCSRSQC